MAGPEDDDLTPDEMRDWLKQELRNLTKAVELRTKDATDFVTAYCLGEISSAEAGRRLTQYQDRWNEAIPGLVTDETIADDEIVAQLDRRFAETIVSRSKGRGTQKGE